MTKRIFIFTLTLLAVSISLRAQDPHVKAMSEEALRLYTEQQYIQALDMFKQIQRIDPSNVLAAEYIPKTETSIQEWEKAGGDVRRDASPTWDSLLGKRQPRGVPIDAANAKDIIAARKSLVDRMKNRTTNTSNIVQIQDNRGNLQVTLFHDQLFLPGLQILRDEALPILDNVATLMKQKADREVTIRSLARTDSNDPFLLFPDYPLPASEPGFSKKGGNDSRFIFQDIEATRSFILFTYLADRSMTR